MNTSNQIQPWHREAAKAICLSVNRDFHEFAEAGHVAAIIAAHDPHQETVRLLEAAMYQIGFSPLCAEIAAHLSRVKGGAQ